MFRSYSTRKRAITTSILLSIVLFLFISPIANIIFEALLPPQSVKNIKVVEKGNAITVTWDKNSEADLKGYVVKVNNDEINVDNTVDNYVLPEVEKGKEYNISVSSIDRNKMVSSPAIFSVKSSGSTQSFIVNEYFSFYEVSRFIFFTSFAAAIVLFVFTLWVLFFKVKGAALITIAAFPSFAIIPYLIVSLSILTSIGSTLNKVIFSAAIALGFSIITYLLVLTANILNGSLYIQLPLEQAGKAAQFIFSLISSYLILIYVFASNQSILLRLILSSLFIIYFSYSSIWMNKNVSLKQVTIRSVSILLVMILSIVLLSIWPIESAYAILTVSVIYYILLNIALEVRSKLGRAVWIEYGVLLVLVLILLLTNGDWGINGTLI